MKMLGRVMGLLVLLCVSAAGFSIYSYVTPSLREDKTIFIAPQTGARGILVQLHSEGILPPLPVIALPLLMTTNHRMLKAGEYAFVAGSSPARVIAKIARGEVVVHKVAIPEGRNRWQVRATLMNEPLLAGELPTVIAEGSVLPDTMHFERGEARAAVLARMQKAQTALMATLWENRAADLPVHTPEDAIILASVVEKETGVVDERALVAGVFINRLRLGMKLQSDPTVVYGLELRQGGKPLGRPLSRADLQSPTAYNSYLREGLPPTPICNPGRQAIEAVLHPQATDALYFVATGTGGHRFSTTLKEHEANVALYRQTLKESMKAVEPLPRR